LKKVLIISYYWPPSAGAGVQRWLKFSKYLRDFGWEPVVYTPENPESPHDDHSLLSDIPHGMLQLKRPIREPYQLYKLFTGRSGKEKFQPGFLNERKKPGLADQAARWVRGNFFIPDARKFWIRPSVNYLSAWLRDHPVDALVSTGPPHSMHLIALKLKQRLGIPWLADFRDPWTRIDFYHKLRLTRWADRRHRYLENLVLTTADRVVTVSRHVASELEGISGRSVEVVANGYDPEDFREIPPFDYGKFSLTHLGYMNADRNPHALWAALAGLVKEVPGFSDDLQIKLIGKTDVSVTGTLEKLGLKGFVRNLQYLPHAQALQEAGNSSVLLLPLNRTPNALGIVTGKLFEYLALKRPILCIGPPTGDAAAIIRKSGSGTTAGFDDWEAVKEVLSEWYSAFKQKRLAWQGSGTGPYSRVALTEKMAGLLDGMMRNP
jgi:glycosyltransferase involved in cell wall biosynthesis